MNKRNPVSASQNIWSDAQLVDNIDLSTEQDYNDTITSGIINNHIGSGVLLETLESNILFDSNLVTGFLDGLNIQPQFQPSDNNLGNILEIELKNSKVAGKKSIKICIIGLDFQSNLQYETFYFKCNEIQISKKHFTKILVLLFNDFIGDPNLSFNLGGEIIIKESKSFFISRDPKILAQDLQPNLFFRDFFLDSATSINILLQEALPSYNIDSLNIFMTEQDSKILNVNDVTTQIGQKFKAVTNNIQKITLLLSVQNQVLGSENDLVWNGDLVVSIFPLQSNVSCPTDIAPNLEIDFSPSNIPIAQIGLSYSSLQDSGIVLDSVPQPVDFVFSNSALAEGKVLIPGNYYVFSVKRSGSANKCDILISSGGNFVDESRITTFTGILWVDIPEEDLWFQMWSDSVKVTDGQAYDSGHGIKIEKTINSGSITDYSFDNLQFTGNSIYTAVLSAAINENTPVQDQRTGNPIFSRKEFVPNINLLNSIEVINLEKTSDPVFLGTVVDKNKKFYDSISSLINSKLHESTLVGDELLIKIIDDPTDTGRFDTLVGALVTNLLNGDLVNAKIIPNSNNSSTFYRIAKSELCSVILGDVNGDGIIDDTDYNLLQSYINFDLNNGLAVSTIITTNGTITTFKNGYTTYRNNFINQFGISFQLVDPVTNNVLLSGTDGVLIANPTNDRLAQFTSTSVDFTNVTGISTYKLVILSNLHIENYGGFDITLLDVGVNVITIQKVILNGDSMLQLLKSDIDGDGYISYTDGYLLRSYIDRLNLPVVPTTIYPQPSTNAYNKIGTNFNILRLKLEKYVDRFDDYVGVVDRADGVHPAPDVFLADGYFANHNFYTSPIPITIQKQLSWEDFLITTNSDPKLVPVTFDTDHEVKTKCNIEGTQITKYNSEPDFNKRNTDSFIPNNLIIGDGQLKNINGSYHKIDFEVGTIVLEIPDGLSGDEKIINLMDNFIVDYTGNGITRSGEKALRFADCSFVTNDAIANNQIRFSVSVQSFSPNINGLSTELYSGAIVDGKIGVAIDQTSGLLTLNFTNLYQDTVLRSLNTKVQINVFLKKGGFNNQALLVSATKVQNMLQVSSSFSGANI